MESQSDVPHRILQLTAVTVDLASGLVRQGAQELVLSSQETALLGYLVRCAPAVVSRDELRREVWNSEADIATRAVDQAVGRLRHKIGEPARKPRHLVGVYGEGYRFVPLPESSPHLVPSAESRGNLTPAVSSFVGRTEDLLALRTHLQRHHAVVLQGPPGVGKSRLARHAAWSWKAEYPDGLWLLDLDSAPSQAETIGRLEAVWGVQASREADPTTRLTQALAALGPEPRSLLIVDNAEDAPQFAAFLAETAAATKPTLRVIITSRVPIPLTLPHLRLEGLPVDLASALLRDRAASFVPAFNDDGAVDTLVALLDGSPLGLELAAPRLRLLSPAEMVRRIGEGRRVLGEAPTGDPRHPSIDAAILSSWETLSDELKAALRALSAFGGTLSHAAAEHMLEEFVPEHDPLLLLDRLLDRSLIQLSGTRPQRLLVYRSVREFVSAHDPEPEVVERRRAVARSLGAWGVGTSHALMGPDQDRIAALLALDLPFIEHACVWTLDHDPDAAVRLLHALTEYSWLTGLSESAQRLSALAVTRELSDPTTIQDMRLIRAVVLVLVLRHTEAEALLRGLDLAEFPWRRRVQAFLLATCETLRDPVQALATIDEALVDLDVSALQMRVIHARLLALRARLRTLVVDTETAYLDLKEARRAWSRIGSPSGEGSAHLYQGMFELNLRRSDDAERSLRRGLALLDRPGGQRQRYLARILIASIEQDRGQFDAALRTIGSPPPMQEHADLGTLFHFKRSHILLEANRIPEAEADLEAIQGYLGDDANPFFAAHATALNARIALVRGDWARLLRSAARARRFFADGVLPTVLLYSGFPLLMLGAATDEVARVQALIPPLTAIAEGAGDRRMLTGFVGVQAALWHAQARAAASESDALAHRARARATLREGRASPTVHEDPALACAEGRFLVTALEAMLNSRGELRSPPSSALREDTQRELDAWAEALMGSDKAI